MSLWYVILCISLVIKTSFCLSFRSKMSVPYLFDIGWNYGKTLDIAVFFHSAMKGKSCYGQAKAKNDSLMKTWLFLSWQLMLNKSTAGSPRQFPANVKGMLGNAENIFTLPQVASGTSTTVAAQFCFMDPTYLWQCGNRIIKILRNLKHYETTTFIIECVHFESYISILCSVLEIVAVFLFYFEDLSLFF